MVSLNSLRVWVVIYAMAFLVTIIALQLSSLLLIRPIDSMSLCMSFSDELPVVGVPVLELQEYELAHSTILILLRPDPGISFSSP